MLQRILLVLLSTIIILCKFSLNRAEASDCDNHLRPTAATSVTIYSKYLKHARKINASLNSQLTKLAGIEGSRSDTLKSMYLAIKKWEADYSSEYVFKNNRPTRLSSSELDYIRGSFANSHNTAQLSEDQLHQFFVNELRYLYLKIEAEFRTQLVKESLEKQHAHLSDKGTRFMARVLELKNSNPYTLADSSLSFKTASHLISEYTLLNEKEMSALIGSINILEAEDGRAEVEDLLSSAGFKFYQISQIIGLWESGSNFPCCTSTPGCRTCPLNRATHK